LGLVEKAGSGIKRIQRLAKDDNINIEFNPKQIGCKSDAKTREKWILNYLKESKTIKSINIMNQFSIAKDTASRGLKSLIKRNKIVRRGRGNNVWYELKKEEGKNDN